MTTAEPIPMRESLRQAEERVSRLRDDNAKLQRSVLRATRRRNRKVFCVVAAVVAAVCGFMLATRLCDARFAREEALAARAHETEMARERAKNDACKAGLNELIAELAACRKVSTRPQPVP